MNIEEKVNAVISFILAETVEETKNSLAILREASKQTAREPTTEDETAKILCDIGYPEHIKGYRYCVHAINLAVSNPDIIDAITCELYPAVAVKFNTTGRRVEKAIRHGIECAWDRCDCKVIGEYFGSTISSHKGRPTNSEFIARISNIVRRRVGSA